MPTFIERIMSATSSNIDHAEFMAHCRVNMADAIDWTTIVEHWEMTPAQDAEATEIDNLFNNETPVLTTAEVEDILCLAHCGTAGYTTDAEVRAKLGLT